MKCLAGGMVKELIVRQVMRAPAPFPLAYPTKDSVVRPDKELVGAFDQNGPAFRANARIYYRDMNRAGWKVFLSSEQVERTRMNVLRWYIVSEVNDPGRRIDGKDHALHRPNEIILCAEVCKESDD